LLGSILRQLRTLFNRYPRDDETVKALAAALLTLFMVMGHKAAYASTVRVVDMTPASESTEEIQNSEPSIAVNPANPNQVAASAFMAAPGGPPLPSISPIYISYDGGDSWALDSILDSAGPSTADATLRFGSKSGILYAAILLFNTHELNILRGSNLLSADKMQKVYELHGDDQPFIEAITTGDGLKTHDVVLVGSNQGAYGPTAKLDDSLDAGTGVMPDNFTPSFLDRRGSTKFDGPSIRTAVLADGTVYEAFFNWRSFYKEPISETYVVSSDVTVQRDDQFGESGNPFGSLVDPDDHFPGVLVAQNRPIRVLDMLGGERIGSFLSIAADPNNSQHVYIAWIDGDAKTDALHVKQSIDGGLHWSGDLIDEPLAVSPGLAVNSGGTAALVYQQYKDGLWVTKVTLSRDGSFVPKSQETVILSRAPSLHPAFQPLLSDYGNMVSVGSSFFGVFAANNFPDLADFPNGAVYQRYADFGQHILYSSNDRKSRKPVQPSIDPFFFRLDP
jgi:hypothetical protein